ncbi:hypothetical protein [Euzebya rosea]|uniref:hypothetical protein n=1 Tax=Euzebya rosea TaxID=2052804 RepID=UPI000D3E9C66|nr:hypothetical protein [Euzebya rosea]
MVLMSGCGAIVLLALAAGVRWRAVEYRAGWYAAPMPARRLRAGVPIARRIFREAALMVLAGALVGLLLIGPAARLVMRALAVLAGPDGSGRPIETGTEMGTITVEGTLVVVVFGGLVAGLLLALVHALLRRLLPDGWRGGALVGAAVLVVVGPLVDPLRPDNPVFATVGHAGVAVALFVAIAVISGAVLAVVHARLSQAVPLPAMRPVRAWLPYVPLAMLVLPDLLLLTELLTASGLGVVLRRRGVIPLQEGTRRTLRLAGLALVAGIVTWKAPGFALAVGHILGA